MTTFLVTVALLLAILSVVTFVYYIETVKEHPELLLWLVPFVVAVVMCFKALGGL